MVNEVESVEFKWGRKKGVGGKKKDVQFYESFVYDAVEYALFDSVYMYANNEPEPYIGKLIKIWENADKTKRVKILWFFRPCEISNYIGTDKTYQNELFLASGDGSGLSNVNPLEAIAGKCNVICISKDSRNLQPSTEELQMADFIFYRTFDVGCCVISDKIDDKIGTVDVKFLFNRVNSEKSSAVPKPDSNNEEVSGNAVVADDMVLLSENDALGQCKTLKTDESSTDALKKEYSDSKVLLANQKSSLGQSTASLSKEVSEVVKLDLTQGNFSDDMTGSKSKVIENAVSIISSVKQKSFLGEKPASNVVVESGEVAKINHPQRNTASDKTSLIFIDKEISGSKPSLVKQKSSLGEKWSSHLGEQLDGMAKSNTQESMHSGKMTSRFKDDLGKGEIKNHKVPATEVQVEEKVQGTRDSGRLEDRQYHKANHGDSLKVSGEKNKKILQKLNHDSSCSDGKTLDPAAAASEDKSKRKLAEDSHGIENISSKKPKHDEKPKNLASDKLPKAYGRGASNYVSKPTNQILEVTRRPEADKCKWFKIHSWEDSLKAAREGGKLVLLQNLDPSYVATEVEDIVWHAFKENCTARVIQRTAYSSPHSGQAFVMFKTREAAEMAVTKLRTCCLLLSNGRPLIGSIVTHSFPGKPTTFFGHISIDKLRLQMQREMKEAVSTPHCSQPNTIEYDMALEWCLLQERTDLEWKQLYKQQGQELRKLKATLKSK